MWINKRQYGKFVNKIMENLYWFILSNAVALKTIQKKHDIDSQYCNKVNSKKIR